MKRLIVLLALAGCATPYQPAGEQGGYSERRIDEDTYLVNYRANGFTSKAQAWDFAMLRAAELTAASGFAYFTVSNWHDLSEQRFTPGGNDVPAQLVTHPAYELRIEMANVAGPETHEASDIIRSMKDSYELD